MDEGQRLQRGTVEGPPLADKTPEVKEEAISIMFISPYVKNGPDQLQSAGGEAEPLPGPSAEPGPGPSAEPGQTKPELEEDGDTASSSSATDHSDEEWRGSEESNTEDSDGKGSSQKVSRLPKGPQLHPVKKARCKTRFCCKICGKSFHHTMSLVNHVEVHGRDVCGVCGKRLKDEEAFRAHLRMHNKGKVCGYCGKCFGSYSSMEKHLRVHTGEKPFKCSECGKSFNCHHNMVRHVRLHTGEKPHHCSICGKAFTRKTAVQAHMKRHAAEK